MRGFKILAIIFAALTYLVLFPTIIMGHFLTTDTLVWIEIRGLDLISYDKAAIWTLVAPLISVAVLLVRGPKMSKIILLMLSMALGGFVYAGSLVTTWQEIFRIAESMILHPGSMLYPMVLNIETIFALVTVLLERDEREENYNVQTTERENPILRI